MNLKAFAAGLLLAVPALLEAQTVMPSGSSVSTSGRRTLPVPL